MSTEAEELLQKIDEATDEVAFRKQEMDDAIAALRKLEERYHELTGEGFTTHVL